MPTDPSVTDTPSMAQRRHDHQAFVRQDHTLVELKRRSARGGVITVATQALKFCLQMGGTMVLARLLTPADFGLVAMVSAFTGFVGLFRDLGLSMATIQREEITHAQVSTLFWINVAASVVLAGIAAALAPLVAWFYGEPELAMITIVVGSTFIFGGLGAQHAALLRRQLQFRSIARIDIISQVAGTLAAIVLATSGAGYWSLVALTGVQGAVSSLLTFTASGWWPGLPRRRAGTRKMLAFGSNLAGASMLNYFIRNADNMILGYFGGPAALGLYTKSYGLLTLPLSQFLTPISAVTVPTLCRLAGDPPKFREFFLRSAGIVVVMVILATAAAFALAPELVAIVLGPGWESASGIFRILAPGAIISSTNIAGAWVCTPLGLTNRQFKSALFVAPTYIVGFLIGSQWGAEGVAAAFSITCGLLRVPVFRYMLRGTPVSPGDIWILMLRPFLVGAAACSLAMATGLFWEGDVFSSLALKTATFVAVIGVAHACKILVLPIEGLRSALRPSSKSVG